MCLAVNAAEGGVGRENGLTAERLSVPFNNDLGFGDGIEDLFEEEL
jgi:hypothetical protein